ncbi:Phosphotransferase enzyme family protein [Nocardioides exalbidus]|uniref:Phosphotransferase enzyme family protein n=1 Tax=Nocardioides exalbidus TaxID=402596 RepID=A0A1H4JIP7_9ACTN|nr:phosphotransferase [Nocardioides exalbidus]SEB45518.1 Phosphotransferase enzyme family protein [Nocardioides exalbidus]
MKATFAPPPGAARRELLGDDDVTDAELESMVADLWGVGSVTLLDSCAERVAYDVPSILTGARTWVRGHADAGDGPRPFTLFVKRVHSWRHAPEFVHVPVEISEWAAASVPWRAEPLLYASDLAARLPDGLTMPRGLRVVEHPDDTAVVWIEAVECDPVPWTYDDSVRAAHLLGRLSASAAVEPLGAIDPQPWHIENFVAGRLAFTVLPGLHDDGTWRHPAIATHFGELRDGLTATAHRLDALAHEFASSRHLTSHGDACPNNLLRREGDPGFTLIDFGFWRPQPVGFDLSQLLVGDIQLGRQDVADLPGRAAACVESYAAGLADEGLDVPPAEVRRAHAVSLMLFNGLPSLPLDLGDEEMARQRAGIARYALDVLADTEPT